MNNPTMLYRCPGTEVFEGVRCETLIVEAEEVESAKAEGWCSNWIEAAAAQKPDNADPANEEQKLRMVHRGRGKYDVLDAAGNVVHDNVTKEEALAKVGG
jgi:hypothetical protein